MKSRLPEQRAELQSEMQTIKSRHEEFKEMCGIDSINQLYEDMHQLKIRVASESTRQDRVMAFMEGIFRFFG